MSSPCPVPSLMALVPTVAGSSLLPNSPPLPCFHISLLSSFMTNTYTQDRGSAYGQKCSIFTIAWFIHFFFVSPHLKTCIFPLLLQNTKRKLFSQRPLLTQRALSLTIAQRSRHRFNSPHLNHSATSSAHVGLRFRCLSLPPLRVL